ncbi:MAG: 4-hydroxy-tetrahydrodipicolinate synthase [Acidimicrobiales bacterium]
MARFGEVVTAMVTPFDEAGRLDPDACAALARWLVDHGSDGLILAGTTGEGPVLSDQERLDLCRAVSEAVTAPVVLGTGSNDTAHSVELTRRAAGCGAAGVLVVTPYYSRPGQAGLDAHFRAVAAATTLPVVIYDIPIRTGRKVAHDVLVRLAHEVPNILGVKDAAGDVAGSAKLIAETPADFECYSGEDKLNLALLAVGAVGVNSVASHWAGPQIADMVAAFSKGDVVGARELNARLAESWDFESTELYPNPLPAKAMMRVLGLAVGQCRLPIGPAPAGLEAEAAAVLERLKARG